MRKALIPAVLIAQALLLAAGCGQAVKYQAAYRGKWNLQSRTLPAGTTLKPPAVNGILVWFPLNKTRAYSSACFSAGEKDARVSESLYTLSGATYTRKEIVKIGGGYGLKPEPGTLTPMTVHHGKIATSGAETILSGDDGRTYTYQDSLLKVTFPNGTVDLWKRFADEAGGLPN